MRVVHTLKISFSFCRITDEVFTLYPVISSSIQLKRPLKILSYSNVVISSNCPSQGIHSLMARVKTLCLFLCVFKFLCGALLHAVLCIARSSFQDTSTQRCRYSTHPLLGFCHSPLHHLASAGPLPRFLGCPLAHVIDHGFSPLNYDIGHFGVHLYRGHEPYEHEYYHDCPKQKLRNHRVRPAEYRIHKSSRLCRNLLCYRSKCGDAGVIFKLNHFTYKKEHECREYSDKGPVYEFLPPLACKFCSIGKDHGDKGKRRD